MDSSEVYPESSGCLLIWAVIALLVARETEWVCGLRPLVQPRVHQQLPCIKLRQYPGQILPKDQLIFHHCAESSSFCTLFSV